jgi:8-oxo-dGTP diphosphatase
MFVFKEPPAHFAPRVEVAGCYCEHRNLFLLLKRSAHKSYGNTWGIPGGKLESGESPLDAIIREMEEETALILHPSQLSYIDKVYIRKPEVDFIFHLFRYPFDSLPSIVLNEEHEEFRWVSLEQALTLPLLPGADECLFFVYR